MTTPRRFVLLAAGFAVLFAANGYTQEKGKAPPAATKESKDLPKGYLPANWKKLGLTDAQRDKILAISGTYSAEIDQLEERIKQLKEKKTREQLDVLTDAQKKALEDIYKRKAGTDK